MANKWRIDVEQIKHDEHTVKEFDWAIIVRDPDGHWVQDLSLYADENDARKLANVLDKLFRSMQTVEINWQKAAERLHDDLQTLVLGENDAESTSPTDSASSDSSV